MVRKTRKSVRRLLNEDDFFRLDRLSSPAVSADGSRIAYVVSTPDLGENRFRSSIHVISIEGGEHLELTSGSHRDTSPAWAPQGTRLAFVSDRDGSQQIYAIDAAGGEARRLTDLPIAPIEPRWLPDGCGIVFMGIVPAEARDLAEVGKRLQERVSAKVRVRVTEDRLYRFWDKWHVLGDFMHLFVLDLESREVLDLTPGMRRFFDLWDPLGSFDVSPDGQELAFSANTTRQPYPSIGSAIFTVPVTGGPLRQLTAEDLFHHDLPRYSPDGRWLVWGTQTQRDFYADPIRLMRYERATGQTRPLAAEWNASPAEWAFTRDSRRLVMTAECEQRSGIFTLAVSGEEAVPTRVADPGWATGVRPAADDNAVFLLGSLTRPPEIARVDLQSGAVTRLTSSAETVLAGVELGAVRQMRFEGAGGHPISMHVMLPPGYRQGERYPLVQLVHGGPHSSWGDDWGWRWCPQLFAAQGCVTAMVNFHGSTGFGEQFLRSLHGAQPFAPFEDIMRATDYLIAEGLADPKRLAAAGASYGGYMIAWIAGHTDRFKALVDHAGVFDLMTQYGEDKTYGNERAYGAAPWDGPEALAKIHAQSPSNFSQAFRTPVLVTHGEQDFRVPTAHSFLFYNLLQAQEIPSRLVIYPDENHWILKPAHSRHWFGEVLGWLKRWGVTSSR
ncbi:MAG: S9 family peptidase [Candidatus Wallbacteria bacterium]|nr:S9 family peptidase [Candidatus Wallbacteria bacterium]